MSENNEVENVVDESTIENRNIPNVPSTSTSSSNYSIEKSLTDKKKVTWIRGDYITSSLNIFQPQPSETIALSSPLQLFNNYFSEELLQTAVFNTNL